MADYLFTWKPDKWPYEALKALVDAFEAGGVVIEPWRCQAHVAVHAGDRAYLLKQGKPRGIFATAGVIGPAQERRNPRPGEARFEVPLRFEILRDPAKQFLVSENQLLSLPTAAHRWNTQASGIKLESEAARLIDGIVEHERSPTGESTYGQDAAQLAAKRERLSEVYNRDQSLVNELRHLYNGRCQICDSSPFNGLFGSIVEGHHIEWLCRGGQDSLENLVLLCPNHHAAIHAADPTFDRVKLEFRFGPKAIPIRIDRHLKLTK